MSGMDIYEDGFPHSTREGYQRGCKGGNCPALDDGLLSCSQAAIRYNGDYQYKKRVDAGYAPEQLAQVDRELTAQARLSAAKSPRKTSTDTVYAEPTTTVASSAEPIEKTAPPAAAKPTPPPPFRRRSSRRHPPPWRRRAACPSPTTASASPATAPPTGTPTDAGAPTAPASRPSDAPAGKQPSTEPATTLEPRRNATQLHRNTP